MNDPIITQVPAMCAPENLKKQELVAQVNYLQDTLLRQGQTLHEVNTKLAEMCITAHQLASCLYALVDSYDVNDREAIAVQLQRLSERRQAFKKPEVH
ncbi:MAG: hypothetical protein Q7S51_10285 [Gallionellaceae bacterium]|nr:hypothetical protein [Gallionellaceae bacterium]